VGVSRTGHFPPERLRGVPTGNPLEAATQSYGEADVVELGRAWGYALIAEGHEFSY